MDCIELNKQNIWGKVTHYKENKAYIAMCAVIDQNGTEFILYREAKGDQIFWMRPVDNYFSSVTVNGIEEVRFKETTAPRTGAKKQIEKIIELLKKDSIEITNELTSEKYCITTHGSLAQCSRESALKRKRAREKNLWRSKYICTSSARL